LQSIRQKSKRQIIERKDAEMSDAQIAAGWYPDPAGDQTKNRYWDGQNWTDQLVDIATSAETTPAPVEQTATAPFAPTTPPTYTDQYQQQQPVYQQAVYQQHPMQSTAAPDEDKKGLAIASLVLGLCGLPSILLLALFGYIFGTLAVVFGAMGRKSSMKNLATAGLVIGIVVLGLSCISSIIGIAISLSYL
jgi:hypothetical protein